MNSEFAIEADHLSKCFSLRHPRQDEHGNAVYDLWALKDVSFKIRKGESVGIIGPNGSGKSTLLQILSGVTKPTSGKVTIRGKVASILDIGTGFHLELSGRENIFLNGQLHGFSKHVIKAKFDDIVAFSGIEKFIDEPVKNYSSGMYLRLAFSIMANLDFDVYLMDEVMSVGDVEFMAKAKAKIQEFVRQGKTIVFVSHNMSELQNQQLYLLLEYGVLKAVTEKKSILEEYVESKIDLDQINISTHAFEITDFSNYEPSPDLEMKQIRFFQRETDSFQTDQEFILEIEYQKLVNSGTIDVVFSISDYQDNMILSSSPFVTGTFSENTAAGKYFHRCIIPRNLFIEQVYKIHIYFLKNSRNIGSKDTEQIALREIKATERALGFPDLIVFKPVFFNKSKSADLSSLNLKGRLLSGFTWESNDNSEQHSRNA